MERATGFEPVYDGNSCVLILGSFPSVKSRAVGFYYGNPQNRFWRTVCGFFGEEIPPDTAGKKEFLLRRRIALWDVLASCEIEGSADSSIRSESVVDLTKIINESKVQVVFCNGSKSYSVLESNYPQFLSMTRKLPSTSPANPRFSKEVWFDALRSAFN